MVCDHCGSDAHVTGYKNCPKYCTVCVASGHSRNTNACPNRICSKCHATGHMARQCTFCVTCQTNHDKNTCCTVCVTTGQCRNTNACPNRVCTKCQTIGHTARQCTFCDTCQTNHAKNKCPNQQCTYCEEYGHDAKRCPEKPTPLCYACGSSTHQTPRSVDCSEHKCATCQGELEPKGHNHKNCPLAHCDACNLSGHIADVCTFRQCYDVEVDYLNLLLLTKGRNTIESYFDANGEACIQPNALRIHGKFTGSIDWDDVKQRFAIMPIGKFSNSRASHTISSAPRHKNTIVRNAK